MSESARQRGPIGRAWGWLRWPAAIGLLGYLVYFNVYLNADELLQRDVQWWAVAAAIVCFTIALLLTYFRWYLLVWAQDFDFEFVDAIRLGLVGMLFNFIAPGSVGGDVVKGAMIARTQRSRRLVAAATVFLDRCVGTLGLFLLGGIAYLALPPWYRTGPLKLIAILFAIGAVIGILGLVVALTPAITGSRWMRATTKWPYVGRFLRGSIDAVRIYQARWRVVVLCVLISLVGQMGMLSTFYFCSRALARGSAVPGFQPQLVFGAGSNFVQAFVPTPGGVGGFESAYAGGYLATDGLSIDHFRATHGPAAIPPEWPAAFAQLLERENGGALAGVAAGRRDVTTAQLTAALTALVEQRAEPATAFERGVEGVPAAAIRKAYRAGHGLLAFREGLLAALGFRVLTVLVALIGAVLYVISRREFDTAIDRQEDALDHSADESSPMRREPVESRESDRIAGSTSNRACD